MKTNIRRAVPSDAGLLTEVCMRSKRSNGYDDEFMEACRQELTVTPKSTLVDEYWLAESTEIGGESIVEVQGLVCLSPEPNAAAGKIQAFFIDPKWQRQGLGRLLWQHIVQRTKIHQLERLYLDADPVAEAFYEAMGFETIGRIPSGSIEGRALPRMEVILSSVDF